MKTLLSKKRALTVGAAMCAALVIASTLQASIVNSVLNTTPASGSTNRITLEIVPPSLFGNRSVTARVDGTVNTRLSLVMNPFTGELLSFDGLELTGGRCIFIDDSDGDRVLSVSWSILFGTSGLDVDISNMACSFDTPNPPGSVVPTSNHGVFNFPTEEHEVIINEGTVVADGWGLASSVSYNMNFASDSMNATTEGTGSIAIGNPSVSGTRATYSLQLELPIEVDETFEVDPTLGDATISGAATFKATGSFNFTLTPVALPGDLNGDGFVGSADLDIVRGNWGGTVTPGYLPGGDASGDGQIGSADLDVVRGNWGAGTPPAAAVPEPSVLAGIAMLLLSAFGIRRK